MEATYIIWQASKIYEGHVNNNDAIQFKDEVIVYDYNFMKAALNEASKEHAQAHRVYRTIAPILMRRYSDYQWCYGDCSNTSYKLEHIEYMLSRYDPSSFRSRVQEIEEDNRRRAERAKMLADKRACQASLLESNIKLGFVSY